MLGHARLHAGRRLMRMLAGANHVHRLANLDDAHRALATRLDASIVLATVAGERKLEQLAVQSDHHRAERTRNVVDRVRGARENDAQFAICEYRIERRRNVKGLLCGGSSASWFLLASGIVVNGSICKD